MLKVNGFAKDPATKKLARWGIEVTEFEHQGQIELLLHDLMKEAELIFGSKFKGPTLLLIEPIKELVDQVA